MTTQAPSRSPAAHASESNEDYKLARLNTIKQISAWIIVTFGITTLALCKSGYEIKKDSYDRLVQVNKWSGEMRILDGDRIVVPKTQDDEDADERRKLEAQSNQHPDLTVLGGTAFVLVAVAILVMLVYVYEVAQRKLVANRLENR